jgi:hypothetical protein
MDEKQVRAFLWTQGAGRTIIDQIVGDMRRAKIRERQAADADQFFSDACSALKQAVSEITIDISKKRGGE